LYNADTFNEVSPTSNDTADLAQWGAAVYDAMAASDPDAVWVMQGILQAAPHALQSGTDAYRDVTL
jgi:alpha-N-acetylglucosaminidase